MGDYKQALADLQEARSLNRLYRQMLPLDRQEALLNEKLPDRVNSYIGMALLEVGDFYYLRGEYAKVKTYYREYLETAQEGNLYWLISYGLAKAGELTKDQETTDWVVKKAKGKDNITSRVMIPSLRQLMLWKIQTVPTLKLLSGKHQQSKNSEDRKIFWQSFLGKEEEKPKIGV